MSKSLKNYILPSEVTAQFGADTLRYYTIGGALPGLDLNYNLDDTKVKFRNLGILSNLQTFVIDYAKQNKFTKDTKPKEFGIEERYMISRLNSAIKLTTENFESYNIDRTPWAAETAFLDLSRGYIQLVREKSTSGTEDEKKAVFYTIYHSLLEGLKILAPVIPFITEDIYQNLKKEFGLETESIHLLDWPKFDVSKIDLRLEKSIELANVVSQALLAIRDKEKLGVRWPLKSATIIVNKDNSEEYELLLSVVPIIKKQVNVKEVNLELSSIGIEAKVEGGFRYGEVKLDTVMTPELEKEGFAREITRRVQALRKEAGLKKQDSIELFVSLDYDLSEWKKEIMDKVGAVKLEFASGDSKFKNSGEIRGKKFEIGLNGV
jgi:isoleucyl-tRNA synthetase